MSIEILNIPTLELKKKILQIYKAEYKEKENKINESSINLIKNIMNNREIKEMLVSIQREDYFEDMNYESLAKIQESASILSENLKEVKEKVELDQFFSKGYNLDIPELKKKYKQRKLGKEFPNINFDKIKELYIYPPKELVTHYDENKKISIDAFVFRKYFLAILQMIFNHMDFVVCNIGDEGAGKSCKCSQDMYMVWWIMKEIGIIEYEFSIKEMFANTLERFGELEDKYYGVPFRIIGLDEGNELNRQDWKEESVKLFWQRLRRERYERRIKFINIPVLGEMIINIVLSRINFIFNMLNRNEVKTGTLFKGNYDFYIIPRGDKIYSPYLNRELKKEEIKNKLYLNLKDKEYLKGLPRDIKIKRCYCNGVWAFKEDDYIKELKETNRKYRIHKGIRFGHSELYAIYKARPTMKALGVKKGDVIYPSLNTMLHKIKKYWTNDAELLLKYETIFRHKVEEKEDAREQQRPARL